MTAPGSLQAQLELIDALDRYESAERLAQILPSIPALGLAADDRHQTMFSAALACGFEPGGRHAHLTSLEWSRGRVELIRTTLPAHVAEVGR